MTKPRDEWGPADEMANAWVIVWAVLIVGCVSWGVGSAVTNIAHETFTRKELNKRGYIKCVNGHAEIGNIDLTGLVNPIDVQSLCKKDDE